MSNWPPGPGWTRSGLSLMAWSWSISYAFFVASTTGLFRSATVAPDSSASSPMKSA